MSEHTIDDRFAAARTLAAALVDFFRDERPDVAIVLGSGLSQIADHLHAPRILSFDDAPGMKSSGTVGHQGRFILGDIKGRTILFMQGRMHYYEGHDIDAVVLAVRAMAIAGIDKLILTNAAGAVNRAYKAGNIALIKDHISLFCPSPLRGVNDERIGPRFPDQTHVYDPALMSLARQAAETVNVRLRESVYCYTQGPQYETPAEIDLLGRLGADLVGMSTVAEAIAANHAGMRVLALSGVTNMAAGISQQVLAHEDVMRTGRMLGIDLLKLLVEILKHI